MQVFFILFHFILLVRRALLDVAQSHEQLLRKVGWIYPFQTTPLTVRFCSADTKPDLMYVWQN